MVRSISQNKLEEKDLAYLMSWAKRLGNALLDATSREIRLLDDGTGQLTVNYRDVFSLVVAVQELDGLRTMALENREAEATVASLRRSRQLLARP